LNHDHGDVGVFFLVLDIVSMVISQWCCKKEPHGKHVVVEVDEPCMQLGVDIKKQGDDVIKQGGGF